MRATGVAFAAVALIAFAVRAEAQDGADPPAEDTRNAYSIDGIRLFDKHDELASRGFSCTASIYPGMNWCVGPATAERRGDAQFTKLTGYNSDSAGRVVYVVSILRGYPGLIAVGSLQYAGLEGVLSKPLHISLSSRQFDLGVEHKFADQGRTVQSSILAWGDLWLTRLTDDEYQKVAGGASLRQGYLIDHRFDLTRSAKERDPIYKVEGNFGLVLHVLPSSSDRSRSDIVLRAIYQPAFTPNDRRRALRVPPAQTSTRYQDSEPRRQYESVKAAVQSYYDRERKDFPPAGADTYMPPFCGDGKTELAGSTSNANPMLDAFMRIAYDVVLWRNDLQRFGYPDALWLASLERFEASELDLALTGKHNPDGEAWEKRRSAFREKLMLVLNEARKANPSFPNVIMFGCGADETPIKIATQPPGATVFLIPSFFYDLCRAQNLDPEDRNRCNRWREVDDGMSVPVSGRYQYLARWPDGATRRGTLDFEQPGPDFVVVVRKE